MAFTTSPREYQRRVQAAIQFRESTTYKEVMQGNDPVAVYKFSLGEQAKKYPTTVKSKPRDGNPAIRSLDVGTGAALIKRGRFNCNADRFEQIVNEHSPNAGLQKKPHKRMAYCKEVANGADRMVNSPRVMQERSRYEQAIGREKIDQSVKQKDKTTPKTPASKQNLNQQKIQYAAKQMERER